MDDGLSRLLREIRDIMTRLGMNDVRKKRMRRWMLVLIVLPFWYISSHALTVWLIARGLCPEFWSGLYDSVYAPVVWAINEAPQPIGAIARCYYRFLVYLVL